MGAGEAFVDTDLTALASECVALDAADELAKAVAKANMPNQQKPEVA